MLLREYRCRLLWERVHFHNLLQVRQYLSYCVNSVENGEEADPVSSPETETAPETEAEAEAPTKWSLEGALWTPAWWSSTTLEEIPSAGTCAFRAAI